MKIIFWKDNPPHFSKNCNMWYQGISRWNEVMRGETTLYALWTAYTRWNDVIRALNYLYAVKRTRLCALWTIYTRWDKFTSSSMWIN